MRRRLVLALALALWALAAQAPRPAIAQPAPVLIPPPPAPDPAPTPAPAPTEPAPAPAEPVAPPGPSDAPPPAPGDLPAPSEAPPPAPPVPAPPPVIAPVSPSPAGQVSAGAAAPTPGGRRELGIIAGGKLGGIVPLDGLSLFVHGGIELGYVLPALQRRLAIVVSVDYTRPSASNQEQDPRVMGGGYTWKLTQHELGLMATAIYRATMVRPVIPYVGIGPRILLTRSQVRDAGGPPISMTTERSTRVGFGIPIGGELPLGPGRLIGEVLLQYGTLDHVATGDSHTGAFTLEVGYRLVL